MKAFDLRNSSGLMILMAVAALRAMPGPGTLVVMGICSPDISTCNPAVYPAGFMGALDILCYMGTVSGHIVLAPPSTTMFAPVM